MKKIATAIAATLLSVSAFAAGSIGLERGHIAQRHGDAHVNTTAIVGTYGLGKGLTVDGKYQWGRTESKADLNAAEVGLTKELLALSPRTSVGLRGAVGRVYAEGADSVSYYIVEPQVTYRAMNNLFLTASLQNRNDFRGGNRTNSPKVAADYVSGNNVYGVSYTRIAGSVAADQIAVSYKRLF